MARQISLPVPNDMQKQTRFTNLMKSLEDCAYILVQPAYIITIMDESVAPMLENMLMPHKKALPENDPPVIENGDKDETDTFAYLELETGKTYTRGQIAAALRYGNIKAGVLFSHPKRGNLETFLDPESGKVKLGRLKREP